MTSEPHDGPACDCRQCRLEALFVSTFRTLWVQQLSPCLELGLTLDLQHRRSPDCPILLCVAQVRGAPADVLGLAQVSLNAFVSVLAIYERELGRGAPDADQQVRSALLSLAQPICLDRTEARRAALGMKALFPGVLEEALEAEE